MVRKRRSGQAKSNERDTPWKGGARDPEDRYHSYSQLIPGPSTGISTYDMLCSMPWAEYMTLEIKNMTAGGAWGT